MTHQPGKDTVEGNKIRVPRGVRKFRVKKYVVLSNGEVIGQDGRTLRLYPGTRGYIQVNMWERGKQTTELLHRLVAKCFIPNPLNLPEVNHKDGDKLNNKVGNLKWCTRPQNIQHGFDTGLITPTWKGKKGINNPKSKSVQQLDNGGKPITTFCSTYEAERITGISAKGIQEVAGGQRGRKTAGGYSWKYL